ncbi:DUF6541 family protein [Arthrobacter sp. zg-Y769]|uniref:DUF6541 family protein n=1 Tax=Arthrobacter sp. zg-Y769 TaxID=2894191 RepID=UPI001E4EEC08|nr:DUF6541 family protein [Arthrobacter sp. zg-Y769]MCC9203592.1 hypothetical protein [Arthrobacter sp. zg-Y769]
MSVAPAVSVAFCLLILPGFLVVLAARVSLRTVIGLSGAVSASILAVSAVVAPYLGLEWNLGTVLVGTLVAAALTFLVRLLLDRAGNRRPGTGGSGAGHSAAAQHGLSGAHASGRSGGGIAAREAAGLAAVAVAACLIGYRLIQIFQRPEFISQTADNIFHLNVVRYMQETGSGSALTAGGVQGNGPEFYPAVWHSVAALVADAAQVGIPVAANSVNIVIGAILWPLGAVFAARVLFGNRPLVMFAAAVASSAFSAYPYLLVDWGVIYPNFFSMALVLPALSLAVLTLRTRKAGQAGTEIHLWLVLLACPGLALTHPNALLVLLVALLPLVLTAYAGWVVPLWKDRKATGKGTGKVLLCAAVGLAGAAAVCVAWMALRPLPVKDFANTWQPYQTTAQAVGEVLLTTHAARDAAYATAILVIVGAAAMLREKTARWYLVSYLLIAILFVFASGVENSPLRTFLTGGWYDDQNRLAAALAILAVPLTVKGVLVLAGVLGFGLERIRVPARAVAAVSGVAVLAALFVISQDTTVRPAVKKAALAYSLGPNSDIMSTNELALFEQIDELVPEDAAVVGNPWDGSAWVYFVSGRSVVFPHIQALMTPDRALVASSLNQAAENPEVCEALEDLGVEYAVNSGELIYLPGNPANTAYPGIEGLDEAPGFEKVAQVGTAELFRITACD